MQIFKEQLSFTIHMSFAVLVLLPFVSSYHEQVELISSHKSNNHRIPKLSLEHSFEITLHGFLLWASMGFLMPVGILTIRMSNREECGRRLKILFYFHVVLQMFSVLLSTAGAVLSIKKFENGFNNSHQRIGLALYGVIWVQTLIGFYRPWRGTKRRSIWYWVHWMLGTAVSLLGIINIYTGLHAYHEKTSRNIRIWAILFTVEISFIAVLYLFQDKWDYMKKQGVVLGINPITPTDQVNSPRDNQKELLTELAKK